MVGSGHSHAVALRTMGMSNRSKRYRTTVISKDAYAPYSGMLTGYLAGDYELEDFHIDLRRLCNFAGAHFIHRAAVAVDPVRKKVHCEGRAPFDYDVLSINVGSIQSRSGIEGAQDHGIAIKPIADFLRAWKNVLREITDYRTAQTLTVVGGGVAGTEVILALRRAVMRSLERKGKIDIGVKFRLIAAENRPAPETPPKVSAKLREILARKKIEPVFGKRVVKLEKGRILCEGGEIFWTDRCFLTTGAAPPRWIADSAFEKDGKGFLLVNNKLQTLGYPSVFATGDVAGIRKKASPKAGVYAVRQGRILARNLDAACNGKKSMVAYRPQRDFLKILNLGEKTGLMERKGWFAEGHFAWKLKRRIDLKFMNRFRLLPRRRPKRWPKRLGRRTENRLRRMRLQIPGNRSCGNAGRITGTFPFRSQANRQRL